MKNLPSRLRKGFTLIELLVVIAVLGVLATAVIALVNPAKRLNQSKDSKIKNDIGVIARTFQAYYTTSGAGGTPHYPFAVADISGTGEEFSTQPLTPAGAAYTVVKAAACTATPDTDCTAVAVKAALNDPTVAGNVWCWRSATNVFAETTDAACVQ